MFYSLKDTLLICIYPFSFFFFFRSFSSFSRFWSAAHVSSLSAIFFTFFFAVGVTWMYLEPNNVISLLIFVALNFLFLCLDFLGSLSKTLKSLLGI